MISGLELSTLLFYMLMCMHIFITDCIGSMHCSVKQNFTRMSLVTVKNLLGIVHNL